MMELLSDELVKLPIAICKDVLSNLVKRKNDELLVNKKKSLETASGDARSISLESEEVFKNVKIEIDENQTIDKLACHFLKVEDWSREIKFSDLKESKSLKQVFVDLDVYLMPRNKHFSEVERDDVKPLEEVAFGSSRHCIILGGPGAGKTTSMKKISYKSLNGRIGGCTNFPILIRFREFSDSTSLLEEISSIINFKFVFSDYAKQRSLNGTYEEWHRELLLSYLDSLSPLLVLDGFDELSSDYLKNKVVSELRSLSQGLNKTKIFLTCRTGEFPYSLDGFDCYEITPLTETQINELVHNWVSCEDSARQLLVDIRNSPFADTAMKPLTLAHLCAIYERTGKIPEKPKWVYQKVVNLMLEEWDEQRSILRQSCYAEFDVYRKSEFLSNLAYVLTVDFQTTVFTKEQLIKAYSMICDNFDLPKSQAKSVAKELESHTGLFLQTGYEQYEFAHKSIQEYLTADYIVKYPTLDLIREHVELLGAELAIAVAISSNPSLYFSEVTLGLFNYVDIPNAFYNAFISRLVLERPSFNQSVEVSLAAISMLSMRFNEQYLSTVLEQVFLKTNLESCLKFYELEDDSDDTWIFLRLSKPHKRYKLKKMLRLKVGPISEKLLEFT